MTDTLSTQARSERMRLVKSKNTRPELVVRKLCRELGHKGYRLHRKDLAGKPDIAFMGRKIAIFVHGCFWHGHACHGRVRHPKSNLDYWLPKIERNIARDAENVAALKSLGWKTFVIWECETKRTEELASQLSTLLNS
jgi:DNA mismatch endonuclease (patch repair protein)